MECNKDEAMRAKEIAERKFTEKDYAGAKKFALKAQALFPGLEGIPKLLEVLDVHIVAENRSSGEMDWYGILGVDPRADEATIRRHFKKRAIDLHPDKNQSVGANDAFQLVRAAFDVLNDKVKRSAYDARRKIGTFQKLPRQGGFSTAPSSNVHLPQKFPTGSQQPPPSSHGKGPAANGYHKNSGSRTLYGRKHKTDSKQPHSFWTVCNACKMQYEYLRIYLNQVLKCPHCTQNFTATEIPPPSSLSQTPSWYQKPQSSQGHGSFNGTNIGSTGAAQAANMTTQTDERMKREREDGFDFKGDSFSKKRRETGDSYTMNVNGNIPNMTGFRNSESGVGNSNYKSFNYREFSQFDVRNVLADKALREIREKVKEWRSVSERNITKGNIKQKAKEKTKIVKNDDKKKEDGPTTVSINVPDPDFHIFDSDRSENCFLDGEIWAAYDDDDGMPRFYALIREVVSLKPFKMNVSWLNSKTNTELGPMDWIGLGFTKTSGDFRAGKHETIFSVNIFSHRVKFTKGPRGVFRIYPQIGEIWALYRNWSPNWNRETPEEVVHQYDMVEVLVNYDENQGLYVAPLVKASGFRTVFYKYPNPEKVILIPRDEIFRFSHRVPSHKLSGSEALNVPKGGVELDPAATPAELLELTEPANKEMLETVEEVKGDQDSEQR